MSIAPPSSVTMSRPVLTPISIPVSTPITAAADSTLPQQSVVPTARTTPTPVPITALRPTANNDVLAAIQSNDSPLQFAWWKSNPIKLGALAGGG